jgi:uncharacterized repeat protein (TIGR01451 family)
MRRSSRLNAGPAPARRARKAALATCLAVGTLGAAASPALATDPTTFSDNPGDGVTLREAIDATPAGGQINLAAGTYQLTQGGAVGVYDDNNASGDLDVTKPVTIVGQGMDATVIRSANPGPVDGVFHVLSTLNISNLTVAGGLRPLSVASSEQRGFGAGGGFRVGSTGGAPGTLLATRVKIAGNQAFQGAGVFVSGSAGTRSSATLTDSVVAGNLASNFGGGISAFGDVTLNRSGIIGNKSNASGGGLFLWASPRATLTSTNSTIGANQANLHGGGLMTGGTLNFDFTTLAGNSAGGVGRNINFDGGTISFSNSLIAGSADNSCANNAPGDISSGGFNIDQGQTCLPIGDANGDGVADPAVAGDRINVPDTALNLVAPNPNAGVYWFGLGPGSAAIDTGSDFCFQPVDQRGVARPQGPRCDVGAIEQEPPPVIDVGLTTFEENPDPVKVGQNLTYTIGVTNIGNATATDVVVTTSVPAGTNYVGNSANCTRPRADSIRCTFGDLAAGASGTASLTVVPTQQGTLSNRADVSVGGNADVNKGNNQKTTSATVEPGGSVLGNDNNGASFTLRKAFSKRGKSAQVRVQALGAGRAVIRLRGKGSIGTLGTARATFTKAQARTITLKFSKSARAKLRRLKKGTKLTLRTTWTPSGGKASSKNIRLEVKSKNRITLD